MLYKNNNMEQRNQVRVLPPEQLDLIGVADFLWLVIIYLLPTISHWCSMPLYILEPMRLALFTTLLLTNNKTNSYILAISLPLFSFFVGGHPVFLKSILMAVELLVNVWLFWNIKERNVNMAIAAFSSIVLSKLLYYLAKFLLISAGVLQMSMVSTPIWIQIVITVVLSSLFVLRSKE